MSFEQIWNFNFFGRPNFHKPTPSHNPGESEISKPPPPQSPFAGRPNAF